MISKSASLIDLKFSRKTIGILAIALLAIAVPAIATIAGVPDVAIATGGFNWACAGGLLITGLGLVTADPFALAVGVGYSVASC